MTNKDINLLMIEKFPEFKESIDEAMFLGGGIDSSLYTTYAFVFAVELEKLIPLLPESENKITEIFKFLDDSIDTHEEAEDVIVTCVLEYIFFSLFDLKTLYPFMTERICKLADKFYA